VYEALEHRGLFYVDIVDWLSVARAEGVINAFHVDHPFNFTPRSFRGILRSIGFKIVREHISPAHLGHHSGTIQHGFLCTKGVMKSRLAEDGAMEILDEIKRLQAADRKKLVDDARSV